LLDNEEDNEEGKQRHRGDEEGDNNRDQLLGTIFRPINKEVHLSPAIA